jgi:hypothetical protein
VDGRLKVTGTAKCPAEFARANAAHAFLVMSTIARGQITAIDSAEASTSKPKHRRKLRLRLFPKFDAFLRMELVSRYGRGNFQSTFQNSRCKLAWADAAARRPYRNKRAELPTKCQTSAR